VRPENAGWGEKCRTGQIRICRPKLIFFAPKFFAEFFVSKYGKVVYRGICGIAVPRWYRDLDGTRYWYRKSSSAVSRCYFAVQGLFKLL